MYDSSGLGLVFCFHFYSSSSHKVCLGVLFILIFLYGGRGFVLVDE